VGASQRYLPKLGDEVTALGHNGLFMVIAICTKPESVDLKLTGREFILRNISWGSLNPRKNAREDIIPASDAC
jgi:translation initiation factor 2 beta subunit (eIF-2beta)/eIF-5